MTAWASLSDFAAMGGYGLYVWGSFSLAALAVGLEVWAERRRLARALAARDGGRL